MSRVKILKYFVDLCVAMLYYFLGYVVVGYETHVTSRNVLYDINIVTGVARRVSRGQLQPLQDT